MGEAAGRSESLFARRVVDQGLVKPEQVQECLQILAELKAEGAVAMPSLGELLIHKGYLSAVQKDATMRLVESQPSASDVKLPAVPEGERVGKYIKTHKLGEGGMGEVWKAWDTRLLRWVALKFIKGRDAEELARFQREAQTAAKLSHPNIAAVYESHLNYIAMQFIEGQTLHAYPRAEVSRLVEILRQAALAVHHAHEQGIIHRDLKPANIMVASAPSTTTARQPSSGSRRPETPVQVFVMDFGLAKSTSVDSSLSVSGMIVGTPNYMSPEQAKASKAIDRRADVYSLGATLYELLTDEPPFAGPNIYALLKRIVDEEPIAVGRLKPEVDPELETIVIKCLEKDPARRYSSALELAEELARWLDGEPILAHPASAWFRLKKRVRRNPWAWAMAGAVLIALAAGGAIAAGLSYQAEREREASDLVKKAERLWESGDFATVGELARRALELNPGEPDARYWLARLSLRSYQATRRIPEARVVRGLVELIPQRVETPDEKKLREEAAAALRGATHRAMAEGILALLDENLSKAVDQFRRVPRDAPAFWEAEFYLGIAHYLRGEFADARDKLSKHRSRDAAVTLPAWIRTLIALGQQAEQEGGEFSPSFAQAEAACFELGGDAGRLLQAQTLVAWGSAAMARGGDPEESFSRALKLLEGLDDPEAFAAAGDAWFGRAEFRRRRGKLDLDRPTEYAQAAEAYARAPFASGFLRLADTFLSRYSYQAGVGRENGADLALSLKAYQKAHELDPAYADAEIGAALVGRIIQVASSTDIEPIADAYDRSIEALSSVVARHPRSSIAFRVRGLERLEKGERLRERGHDPSADYRQALSDLSRAGEVHPKDAKAFVGRAHARHIVGLFRQSRGEDPTGDFQAALLDLDRVLELNPKDDEVFLHRGQVLQSLGRYRFESSGALSDDYAKAVEAYSLALKVNPKEVAALRYRSLARQAISHIRLESGQDPAEDYRSSIEDATRAIEINARDFESYLCRSAAHHVIARGRQYRGEDAEPSYRAALNDLREAIEVNSRNSNLFQTRSIVHLNLGQFHHLRGRATDDDFASSIRDADQALSINPNLADALRTRGYARQNRAYCSQASGIDPTAEYLAALADFDSALRLNGRDAETYDGRGTARFNLGTHRQTSGRDPTADYAAATDDLSKAIEINARDATAHRFRGLTRQNLALFRSDGGQDATSDFQAAAKDFDRAVEINPLDYEAYRGRGLVRFNFGSMMFRRGGNAEAMWLAAVDDLTRAIELNPADAEAHLCRGTCRGSLSLNYRPALRAEAISDLERAGSLNAQVRDRADRLIRELGGGK